MTKKRQGKNKITDLINQLPTPNDVNKMSDDVSPQKEKKVIIERKKFGTQLQPKIITKLKMRAVQEEMTITDLLEMILIEYLEEK